jgi:streptogramin lyase
MHVGLAGSCKNANEFGSCNGAYSCEPNGTRICGAQVPVTELCDDLDNDCDGLIDEPLNPNDSIGPCGPDSALSVGSGQPEAFDVSPENSFGVEETSEGFLVLSSEDVSGQYIWIANSGDSTVSKLDTQTGCEVARYFADSDPSRTAVDLYGNGIIACRGGDSSIIKIAGTKAYCTDKNGNGVIDTAHDANGNCTIEIEEMVQEDECVLWSVTPDNGNIARAAGVDKDNHIWVGYWETKKLYRLSPEDGSVVTEFQLDERPYGLVIDADGIIWVASRDPHPHRLVKVHPSQGKIGSWPSPGASGDMYGIGIDAYGKIWIATAEGQGAARFDPISSQWTHVWSFSGYGYTRGIVGKTYTDGNGNVVGSKIYVAHHTFGCSTDSESRTVTAIDASTMQVMGHIDLGGFRGPVGVGIDREGYLWTVNQCDGELGKGSATKINTNTWQIEGTYPVHDAPYSYSDMTGYVLGTVTAPKGQYRTVFESPDGRAVRWVRVEIDAFFPPGAGTAVEIRARVASAVDQLISASWSDVYGPYPPDNLPVELGPELSMGQFIEIELTLTTDTQGVSPIVKSLGVVPQSF